MGKRTRLSCVIAGTLVALVTGCSSSGGTGTPSAQQPDATPTSTGPTAAGPTTPPAGIAKPFPAPGSDPCLVLTRALAVQVLGPTATKRTDSGTTATTKRCGFTQGSSQSYAEVGIVIKPRTLAEFTSSFSKFPECRDLTGFGDKAYRCDPVRSSSTTADLFYAVHSGTTSLYIGVDILDSKGNVQPASFNLTQQLAVAILG
jgi:hypothetical protein